MKLNSIPQRINDGSDEDESDDSVGDARVREGGVGGQRSVIHSTSKATKERQDVSYLKIN